MGGIGDRDYIGTARPAPGISIGYLSQEPELDTARDVRGNVELAVAPIRGHLRAASTRSTPGWPRGRTPTSWTALLDEQARVQDAIEAAQG